MNTSEYVIMAYSLTEDTLSELIASFDLNPILLWEISLRQRYDKFLELDKQTILFTI
jgi:hypothetical protein